MKKNSRKSDFIANISLGGADICVLFIVTVEERKASFFVEWNEVIN